MRAGTRWVWLAWGVACTQGGPGLGELAGQGPLAREPAALSGRLEFDLADGAHLDVLVDDWALGLSASDLPMVSVELVVRGDRVLPVDRGLHIGERRLGWIASPGRAWSDPERPAWSWASLPIDLVHEHGNCTHHGVVRFGYQEDRVTEARWQVRSETCALLKFDADGRTPARLEPGEADPDVVGAAWDAEMGARLPVRPLSELGWLPEPTSTTTRFVVADGALYTDGCATRTGPHPHCDTLALPSFSTAKSGFVGVAWMELLQRAGGELAAAELATLVPEAPADWSGVALSHVMDMATGHHDDEAPLADEDGPRMVAFFEAVDRDSKLAHALGFPAASPPGSDFSYHTSDSFLATAAMEAWLVGAGLGPDLSDHVVDTVYRPLGLSPVTGASLRTWEAGRNDGMALGGYGRWWTVDDLARLALFLASDGRIDGVQTLHPGALDRAMQRVPSDRGSAVPGGRYQDHVWATRLLEPCPSWVPYMSGYGGIAVVWLPNGWVYGVVSDGHDHDWTGAALALHELAPWCL
jgi:hypothetical protein